MMPRWTGGVLTTVAFLLMAARPAPAGPAQRVVSVNITSDEILLAIAPERLVAVSVLADDPDISGAVEAAKRVPGRVKADPERILAQSPDLVVIGGQSVDVVKQIESLGIRVIRIEGFESFEWVRALIRTLGEAVGARDRADALIADMDARLAAVRTRVEPHRRPSVLTYNVSGGTSGRGTTFDDVIRAAGGENAGARLGLSGWKRVSLEQVVTADPEVLVMTASQRWRPGFQSELIAHPALGLVRAVREGRVYQLPGRLMVTASHHIVETVEMLARRLHSVAFADAAPRQLTAMGRQGR